MAGVGVLSSLGLFLLLLLASFSAAREERSTRAEFTPVQTLESSKFLALLEHKEGASAVYCSGSITSETTVLTYCTKEPQIAYAGLLAVANKDKAQKRDVTAVKNDSPMKNMMICIVAKWDLGDQVDIVKLNPIGKRGSDLKNCNVLGFRKPKGTEEAGSETAHVMTVLVIGATQCGLAAEAGTLYSNVTESEKEKLTDLTVGGPAVCDGFQRAINKVYKEKKARDPIDCNLYIDIDKYSPWIKDQIKAADEPGAAGGTGGNGTSPSSGYSIHSYLNKYSNWKVLGFLVPTIVTFLQY